MKKIARRVAVLIGAVAVSAGLLGTTAAPAHAAGSDGSSQVALKDSSWT